MNLRAPYLAIGGNENIVRPARNLCSVDPFVRS